MNKRSIKNIILILLLAIYIFIYKIYIFENYMKYSEIVSASFMVGLLALAISLLGFRRDKQTNLSRSIFKAIIFYLVLTFFIMYGIGIFVGFLKNAYSFALPTLIDNILAPIVIIIAMELLRYVVISANKDRKIIIGLITILLMILDLAINTKSLPIHDLEAMFRLSATVIVPIIVKHFLLSYLCFYVGYRSPILYRLIIELYVFIVPFIPNIGEYLQSMIMISLPFLIYAGSYAMIDDRIQKQQPVFYRNRFSIFDFLIACLLISMVCLISGFFPHYIMGIGSDSMRPKINKGDAVILRKVDKKSSIKKGDIIAYNKDGKIIVHRVVKIKKDSYITKGDANKGNDPKDVKIKQIQGVYKFKIPFIAYPTIWIRELLNK